nr:zinc finger, CCHC-type, retrotransposon Gag domain protein [Tanacetum cinerariifolium]
RKYNLSEFDEAFPFLSESQQLQLIPLHPLSVKMIKDGFMLDHHKLLEEPDPDVKQPTKRTLLHVAYGDLEDLTTVSQRSTLPFGSKKAETTLCSFVIQVGSSNQEDYDTEDYEDDDEAQDDGMFLRTMTFLPLRHVIYSFYLCYVLSLYPFTERYAQPYFFSCLIRQRGVTIMVSEPGYETVCSKDLTYAGGNPPTVTIHTWLERFKKQKPHSFEKATAPVDAENWISHMEKIFDKDCKKNTTASTSGQAEKKPGASGHVFAITEGHAANTSDELPGIPPVREVEFNI